MSDRMGMLWGLALAAVSRENETVGELMSGIWRDTDAVERIADRYAAARAMGAEADQWEAVAREAITALGVQPSGTMAPREARALILAGIGEMRAERDRQREDLLYAREKLDQWQKLAITMEEAKIAAENALDAAGIPYDLAGGAA